MAEAIILDVGHGNASVFLDDGRALVVDAGSGDLVARTLRDAQIDHVEALVVSHRHHDHTSELPSLLSDPDLRIDKLFLNADSGRDPTSRFERDLRAGFNDSYRRNRTRLLALNHTAGALFEMPHLQVDVLSPTSDLAFGGIGAPTEGGGTVTPHAMAGVLRVSLPHGRSVLLCADINHQEADVMMQSTDIASTVLVYPHHGGLSGAADEEAFAHRLARATDMQLVFFSHGRTRHSNPRLEVVRGVRAARTSPPVRVACTQLSRNCASQVPGSTGQLDPGLHHAGEAAGHSCAGSIRVDMSLAFPLMSRGSTHLRFVVNEVADNLCCSAVAVANTTASP